MDATVAVDGRRLQAIAEKHRTSVQRQHQELLERRRRHPIRWAAAQRLSRLARWVAP